MHQHWWHIPHWCHNTSWHMVDVGKMKIIGILIKLCKIPFMQSVCTGRSTLNTTNPSASVFLIRIQRFTWKCSTRGELSRFTSEGQVIKIKLSRPRQVGVQSDKFYRIKMWMWRMGCWPWPAVWSLQRVFESVTRWGRRLGRYHYKWWKQVNCNHNFNII